VRGAGRPARTLRVGHENRGNPRSGRRDFPIGRQFLGGFPLAKGRFEHRIVRARPVSTLGVLCSHTERPASFAKDGLHGRRAQHIVSALRGVVVRGHGYGNASSPSVSGAAQLSFVASRERRIPDRFPTTFQPYPSLPAISFRHSEGEFCSGGSWYFGFDWPIERERGLDFREDAYCPGYFAFALQKGQTAWLAASSDKQAPAPDAWERALARKSSLVENQDWADTQNRLKLAADQFLVRRTDGLYTILAGFPWFTDWGRDTMISLPGLCLETGRLEIAASILKAFCGAMDRGIIPNRFPEGNEKPDTNTVDATLWMFHALARYTDAAKDFSLVRQLYPRLVESIEWHLAGTHYGIKADDDDGLLSAGDAQTQLTWMDAKVGDVAFTPRWGKAVEIQALWYGALLETARWAREMDDKNTWGICTEWARKVASSFPDTFWNAREGCLYDCVNSDGRDGAIRPNQIFAVSLPHRLLSGAQEASVVAGVQADLLTPYGLRSLSPRDSRYRGVYEGNAWARDSAYHQGTVWAWPIGAFWEAYLKIHNRSDASKSQVRAWMSPLIAHLDEAGLGSISEIFDGDAPHAPRGCFAQAWSVAEVLRLWRLSA